MFKSVSFELETDVTTTLGPNILRSLAKTYNLTVENDEHTKWTYGGDPEDFSKLSNTISWNVENKKQFDIYINGKQFQNPGIIYDLLNGFEIGNAREDNRVVLKMIINVNLFPFIILNVWEKLQPLLQEVSMHKLDGEDEECRIRIVGNSEMTNCMKTILDESAILVFSRFAPFVHEVDPLLLISSSSSWSHAINDLQELFKVPVVCKTHRQLVVLHEPQEITSEAVQEGIVNVLSKFATEPPPATLNRDMVLVKPNGIPESALCMTNGVDPEEASVSARNGNSLDTVSGDKADANGGSANKNPSLTGVMGIESDNKASLLDRDDEDKRKTAKMDEEAEKGMPEANYLATHLSGPQIGKGPSASQSSSTEDAEMFTDDEDGAPGKIFVYEKELPIKFIIAKYIQMFGKLEDVVDPRNCTIRLDVSDDKQKSKFCIQAKSPEIKQQTYEKLRNLVGNLEVNCKLKTLPLDGTKWSELPEEGRNKFWTSMSLCKVVFLEPTDTEPAAVFGAPGELSKYLDNIDGILPATTTTTSLEKPKRTRRLAATATDASLGANDGSNASPGSSLDFQENHFSHPSATTTEPVCFLHKSGVKLYTFLDDITKLKVDVIVNAANEHLRNVGGVALAIARAGGRTIDEECNALVKKHGPLSTSDVRKTGAGKLKCHMIIHAVGPRSCEYQYDVPKRDKLLKKTFSNILYQASKVCAQTVAIPAISSGIYGVPSNVVAETAVFTIMEFLRKETHTSLKAIALVDITQTTIDLFRGQLYQYTESQEVQPLLDVRAGSFCGGKFVGKPFEVKLESSKTSMPDLHVHHKLVHPLANGEFSSDDSDGAAVAQNDAQGCSICQDALDDAKTLPCGHTFCKDCIDTAFSYKPVCPECGATHGKMTGNQPDGTMKHYIMQQHLPGYDSCGTIVIEYHFPNGTQGKAHPNPGRPYGGTSRQAFLPNNKEGNKVFKLLTEAFGARLLFTIGRSVTTGRDDVVTWNDVHHKTSMDGGPARFGYPDPTYLSRVQEELAAKGIVAKEADAAPGSTSSVIHEKAEKTSPNGNAQSPIKLPKDKLPGSAIKVTDSCYECSKPISGDVEVVSKVCKHPLCKKCASSARKKGQCVCGMVVLSTGVEHRQTRSMTATVDMPTDCVKTQPENGLMSITVDDKKHLPGFENYGILNIRIAFPPGKRKACHENPGKPYSSKEFTPCLPNNDDGLKLYTMWQKVFNDQYLFTIEKGNIAWNIANHGMSKSKWDKNGPKRNPGILNAAIAEMTNLLHSPHD